MRDETAGPGNMAGQGEQTHDHANAVHTDIPRQFSPNGEKQGNAKKEAVKTTPYTSGDVQADRTGNGQTVKGIYREDKSQEHATSNKPTNEQNPAANQKQTNQQKPATGGVKANQAAMDAQIKEANDARKRS
jgi:hypothetical protein